MRTTRLLSLTAACCLAVGLVAACDDNGDDAVDDVTDEVEDVADDVQDRIDDITNGDEVAIDDFGFSPDDLTVSAGTTVTWSNEDSVPHTVTSGTPGDESGDFSEQVGPGESVEITFDDEGTFPYFCEFHNQMTGEITVE